MCKFLFVEANDGHSSAFYDKSALLERLKLRENNFVMLVRTQLNSLTAKSENYVFGLIGH